MASYSRDDVITHAQAAVDEADKATQFSGPMVEGMTSVKIRVLLQALCRLHGAHYLEIGVWKGATLLAATHDSPLVLATVIDNWSTFGGPHDEFLANLFAVEDYLPPVEVINADCWTITPDRIAPPVDVYFYDGCHHTEDQRRAMSHFWPVLSKPAIVVVDDWDDQNYDVPGGTRAGLADVGATILAEWERHTAFQADAEGWWNGVFVAVVA